MGRIYDATWGRAFAAAYDRGLRATEDGGLRRIRADVLSMARGRTIELGAGTGANLDLYPLDVTELVLAEPDRHMLGRLRRKLAVSATAAELVEAPAERLPFADEAFDTAVFTLVLCTAPDPAAALAETARVLRPGGKMLFVEHVRSEQDAVARWQDRWEKPWRFIADGCYCNRETIATIEASPLKLERFDRGRLPMGMPIIEPLVSGSAEKAA